MDYTQRLEEAFRGLGLDERTARVAAIGRAKPDHRTLEGFAANLQAISGRPVREVVHMVRGRDNTPLSEVRRELEEAAKPVEATRHVVVDGVRMTEAAYIKNGPPKRSPRPSGVRRTGARTATPRRVLSEQGRAALAELIELAEPKPGDDDAA